MLLHHCDIDFQGLLQVCLRVCPDTSLTEVQGDGEELTRLLAESGIAKRIEIDENGGEARSCRADFQVLTLNSWATAETRSNRTNIADPTGFRHRCKHPYTSKDAVLRGNFSGRHLRSHALGE